MGKLLNPLYYFGIARDKIIATLLNRYLGDFFKYINQDDFKVKFYQGEIVLYGLELKRGALDFLNLPIAVESGIAGCLKIIIPWDKLTVKPVVLTINDVWLISKPLSSFDFTKETEEDLESKWQKKLNEIKKMQERWEKQQAKRWGGIHEAKSVSLVDRVIFSIMQLIEVRINHVHVLFEDTTSDEKNQYTAALAIDNIALQSDFSEDPTFPGEDIAQRKSMLKSISVSGCRIYLNSCRISELPTYKVKTSDEDGENGYSSHSEHEMDYGDDLKSSMNDQDRTKGSSSRKRLGKTFAAIFNMLRHPPEVDDDDEDEFEQNQNSNNYKNSTSDYFQDNDAYITKESNFNKNQSGNQSKKKKRRSIVDFIQENVNIGNKDKEEDDEIEVEGIVRPADKCEFHRWTMLIEKQLQHILEPLDFTLRYSMNKHDIAHADDPPKKEFEVVIKAINIKLQESQFGHIRSFILFINRYDRYDRARRLAGWRPHLSLRNVKKFRETGKLSKVEAKDHVKDWWHYARDAVINEMRENRKRARWIFIKEYIVRRGRYIELYKRSRLNGKMWVVPSEVLKELDEAYGASRHITLNDPHLALAAKKQVQILNGMPLSRAEKNEMEAIERDHLQVADIMLFRRIADAQLQLEHYKRNRTQLSKPSQRKKRGSIFGFVDEKLENKTGLHQTTDLKTTQSSNLLNFAMGSAGVDTNSAFFTHRPDLNLQRMNEEDQRLTKNLTMEEKADLFSQINYDPKGEKLSVLPADYIMQHVTLIIKKLAITFVTHNESREEIVADTTCLHILRKPEVDKIEFSIGGIEITDHSIIESKEEQIIRRADNNQPDTITKIQRRHAAPVEALVLRKEFLRENTQSWHPTLLQVIRSKIRFRYFYDYMEKQQRCSQNLLFWIDVEHFERQKPVIKHIFEVLEKDTTEFSVRDRIVVKDLIMINRKKTAKEIVKRYIKSEKSLNFVIGTEGEKKLKEAQGKSKYDGMLKQIKGETEDTLHHLFSELKELVWNDMEMHFLKFIKDKWNPRFYNFDPWCSANSLNRTRNESILVLMEYREQPQVHITSKYHSASRKNKLKKQNEEATSKDAKVSPPILGISSLIMDMANIISTAATVAMVECLTNVSDEVNVDETVETRHNRSPLLLERAQPKLAIKVSVACIEVNLRTEMIMRMGSFFLLYEKKIQSVVERASSKNTATHALHQQTEQRRAWRSFDESKVDILLQKPQQLVLELKIGNQKTGGLQIRLPVHREENNKIKVLYAVMLNCGALDLTTSTSSGAKEVPNLLEDESAKKAEFDMYDMLLPYLSIVVEHYREQNQEGGDTYSTIDQKLSQIKSNETTRTQSRETLVRVENIRLRTYTSRIPEHPEWPKQAVSVFIPKIYSKFSDQGVEALILWHTHWYVAWTALRESYDERDDFNVEELEKKKKGKKKKKKKKKKKHAEKKERKNDERAKKTTGEMKDNGSVIEGNTNENAQNSSARKRRNTDEQKKRYESMLKDEVDPQKRSEITRFLLDIKNKEEQFELSARRAKEALQKREEMIIDIKCDVVDIGFMIQSPNIKNFMSENSQRNVFDDDKEDFKLVIKDIHFRQTQWHVRKAIYFHLTNLNLLDYLSVDNEDNKYNYQRTNKVARQPTSQDAVCVIQLGEREDENKGFVLLVDEVNELSDQYQGEDEVVDVVMPYLRLIVPLKTVENGVNVYNKIGSAIKKSAKTFVEEMASAKETYARLRPDMKVTSLRSIKSLRRSRTDSTDNLKKSFSKRRFDDDTKAASEAPPNNGKEKISNNKFEMKDVHTLPASKRGIKHSIAMKLRVRSKTILLECKYDMEDPLVEFCINGIDFTQLKHGNTIPLSELLDKSSGASSVNDGIEPANLNSAQSDFQNIDMNRKDSLRGLSNEYFIQIGKILVKGSSKFDDNGSLYGILVYPSAVIKKVDISRREFKHKKEERKAKLEDTTSLQWDKFEAFVSRKNKSGVEMDKKLNDSGMDGSGQYGQNRYQSKRKKIASQKNEVIRKLLMISRTYVSLESETKHFEIDSDARTYQLKANQELFRKIEARIAELEAHIDPMTVAAISAYQRQIERIIGHLTVKTKEMIDKSASTIESNNDSGSKKGALDVIVEDQNDDAHIENGDSLGNDKNGNAKPIRISQQISVHVNISEKAVFLALVPSNKFNTSDFEEKQRDGILLFPDIELFQATAMETEVRVDILKPEIATRKNVSQEVYVTIQNVTLEDKTEAGKIHRKILKRIDDEDDDQPMLRLDISMPFHKGDPMSTSVEVNQICLVNLGRFLKEALALNPWINSAMKYPLHEDFLFGPPPPPNVYHFDNLSVNGSNIKVCIPVDSYSEEQLLAYVGKVVVKNQHMEHGIGGNKEHPYQRFHISCKDVEMDYYGYERLFNDFERDGVNSANDKYLEPTITNAVNEGYEEKTIMLLEAQTVNMQFNDMLTGYDREYSPVLMHVWLKCENIVAAMPEKAQQAMSYVLKRNNIEQSNLIQVFKFPPAPKTNINIRVATPFAEVKVYETPDPFPMHYVNQMANRVCGLQPIPSMMDDKTDNNDISSDDDTIKLNSSEDIVNRGNFDISKEGIKVPLTSLKWIGDMGEQLKNVGAKQRQMAQNAGRTRATGHGDESELDILNLKDEDTIDNLEDANKIILTLKLKTRALQEDLQRIKHEKETAQAHFGLQMQALGQKLSRKSAKAREALRGLLHDSNTKKST